MLSERDLAELKKGLVDLIVLYRLEKDSCVSREIEAGLTGEKAKDIIEIKYYNIYNIL